MKILFIFRNYKNYLIYINEKPKIVQKYQFTSPDPWILNLLFLYAQIYPILIFHLLFLMTFKRKSTGVSRLALLCAVLQTQVWLVTILVTQIGQQPWVCISSMAHQHLFNDKPLGLPHRQRYSSSCWIGSKSSLDLDSTFCWMEPFPNRAGCKL